MGYPCYVGFPSQEKRGQMRIQYGVCSLYMLDKQTIADLEKLRQKKQAFFQTLFKEKIMVLNNLLKSSKKIFFFRTNK